MAMQSHAKSQQHIDDIALAFVDEIGHFVQQGHAKQSMLYAEIFPPPGAAKIAGGQPTRSWPVSL